MLTRANLRPVEAAVPAAIHESSQATRLREASSWQARLPLQPRLRLNASRGFTLVELLVSFGVLALLVFFVTSLLNSAATITTLGHKQMDADSQARQLLDRMAVDFAQMVKRPDVDYYVKSSATAPARRALQPGNDQIAFYSTVPGYYPSSGSPSPVSLVAYRVNAQNKLERMGKGLVWNAVSSTDTPVVFIPIPLASPLPTPEFPSPSPNPTPSPAWPSAANLAAAPTPEPSAEVIGPQVFRFEYYYLLKGQTITDTTTGTTTTYTSTVSTTPWDTRISTCCATRPGSPCCHNSVNGMEDVAAVIVNIAVIDSKSRVLLTDAQITTIANGLSDYNGEAPGVFRANWQTYLDGITNMPRPAISGIRVYERYLYLSPPTLGTL
jgi:Prokaryotic N-terminal methylation motif